MPEIKVMPDPQAVAHEAANRVVAAAEAAIELRGVFSIALAGGSTPEAMFKLLATDPYRSAIDWTKVHVYFGDERCVPPDHKDSNYRMARETLLSKVNIPGDNIYRIHGESDPQEAARQYGELLKEQFGDEGGIDLILLGMGDDGHTASLFPHTEALHETKHRCVANYVDEKKTWRITMTYPFINRADAVLICVTGAAKTDRLREVLEGPLDPERLPVQKIAPASGKLTWLLDAAAAGM
ncbi:MAG: 6-phosphogluconolactonase [Phycisphaerae bacterium]|nr:6-phosphogluconolactonase [Phycisphaerae bacterium]